MTPRRIIVIGAGVVGLLGAWALARRGAAVTVIDRQPGPAEECSRANAGILAVGHASAWAGPSAIGSMLRAVAGREPGVRVTRLGDPALWRWGMRFLSQCTATAHARNTERLQRLSRLSRSLMPGIEAELGLGGLRHEGGFYLFQDAGQFAAHAASVTTDGEMEILDRSALIASEPALAPLSDRLAGGLYSALDSVGDCHLFSRSLAGVLAERYGVEFQFGSSVTGFERAGRKLTAVATDRGAVVSDTILLATGTETGALTRPLGFSPAIYPVKGYSGTWAIRDPARIPRRPFVDETELLAVASYGGNLRVTAIAEFAGRSDLSIPDRSRALLSDYVARCFGDAVDPESARYWAGQRPSTPAGPPFLGRVRRFDNLWINAGHGQLGWTMAAGSAEIVARAMNHEQSGVGGVSSAARWLEAL